MSSKHFVLTATALVVALTSWQQRLSADDEDMEENALTYECYAVATVVYEEMGAEITMEYLGIGIDSDHEEAKQEAREDAADQAAADGFSNAEINDDTCTQMPMEKAVPTAAKGDIVVAKFRLEVRSQGSGPKRRLVRLGTGRDDSEAAARGKAMQDAARVLRLIPRRNDFKKGNVVIKGKFTS